MTRGEVYRTRERIAERGGKPGFYGLTTEVVLGPDDGLPRTSAIRCDFLTLMFKSRLTHFVSTLSAEKIQSLNRALAVALELPAELDHRRH